MATYYVDFVNGLDANNGLGPDASHASNKPWKTIAKLLGAAGMGSGDTAYLSPAGPFRETIVVAMTSAVAETLVIGDWANAQGFKTSGAVLVSPGQVIVSAHTTNDTTAPAAANTLNLSARDFLTFRNITFMGGNTADSCVSGGVGANNITFTDCTFFTYPAVASARAIAFTVVAGVAASWLLDRCRLQGALGNTANGLITITMTRHSADYDAAIVIRNCTILMGTNTAVRVVSTGAGAGFGGGITIRSCTLSALNGVLTGDANLSTTFPIKVTGCLVVAGVALNANASGQIVEDHNLLAAVTARTNVTAGTGSVAGTYPMAVQIGQELGYGSLQRAYLEPAAGSTLLGFGSDGSAPSVDIRNRIRPAGGSSASPAAGALERGNTWIADPSPIGTGASAIKVTGPAYAEFLVPVPALAVTISVVVKWDATYAGTKPQLQMDANNKIGVATQTVTAVGSSGSNETLTLAGFTPSAAGGMVTLRVLSNDTNGAGVVQADNFSVTV